MNGDPSQRLLIRQGRLARTERTDPDGALDAREPEELFDFDAGADAIQPPASEKLPPKKNRQARLTSSD